MVLADFYDFSTVDFVTGRNHLIIDDSASSAVGGEDRPEDELPLFALFCLLRM